MNKMMQHIKRLYSLLIIGVLWFLPVKAQDTLVLDLIRCRTMVLENSHSIKIAEENIRKAEGEKMAARAAWLPDISASATGLYNKTEIEKELTLPTQVYNPATGEIVPNVVVDPATGFPVYGPDGNPVFKMYAFLPLELTLQGGALAGISAQQPLYAGGKIMAGNKMANIGNEMAQKNKTLKESHMIFEADKAYYQYLSVKEKVKLAKKYKTLLDEVVKVVEDSYETGMSNRNDMLKVQVKYNDAVLEAQKAETGLELARMSLCRTIGLPLDSPLAVQDSMGEISFIEQNLSSASAHNRIEYELLEKQVKMAEQEVKMVRGDFLPTAGVSLSYNYFMVSLQDADNFDDHGVSAMGSLKIPITHFGERKGKMASAKADYTIKKLELQQAKDYLQLEIEQARLNYIDAYTRVQMAEEALKQASENMRISDNNYELGMETVVNLLEAKAEWQKAYANKIEAVADFRVKESNWQRVTHKLTKK